ncbi:hypothetical protein [Methylorubrum extorquens]|uniref:hypothetical protein n=1 Tax=Methylorubrum extorquens TaxID=408 RepID=UPI0022383EE3|nr:hypothetical protein [Methylorubrum extorquens]UYW34259.1 hypothetical protein OKB92_09320 [Methylorubrum extorquens]
MDGIGIGIDWDETKEPAYRDGRRAGERREEAESNPQASGSDDHRLWQAGHASVTAPDIVADKIGDFA